MTNDRTFNVIRGYLPCDGWPARARAHGLRHRVAFALDSYRRDSTDAFFDVDLWSRLVEAVREAAPGDEIAPIGEAHVDEPTACLVLRGQAIVALVEPELWVYAGGPRPYHDTYTLTAFFIQDVTEALLKAAHVRTAALGAVQLNVYDGSKTPPSLLTRLRYALFGWEPDAINSRKS